MLPATPDVIETFDIQTPILMFDYRIGDIVSTGPESRDLVAIKVAFVLGLDVAVLFLLVRAYAGVFWGVITRLFDCLWTNNL